MYSIKVYLISQVGREVVGAWVVEVAGQSHISMAKEDQVRCSAGDQEVRAHIKLFPFQEQRTLNVTESKMSVYLQDDFNSYISICHLSFVICQQDDVDKYNRQLSN